LLNADEKSIGFFFSIRIQQSTIELPLHSFYAAWALMLRVIIFCQTAPTDIFQDRRDVFALIAGFGVAAKDKVYVAD